MAQANVLTALQSGEIATPEESQLSTIVAEPPRRKPGRPPGMKTRTDAELLRRHHFAFLRATTEGVALRKAWELYLSGEGGPDDERHFVARLRRLDQLVRVGAEAHGLAEKATLALAGLDRLWRKPPPKKPAADGPPTSPALPSPPAASPAAPRRCGCSGCPTTPPT